MSPSGSAFGGERGRGEVLLHRCKLFFEIPLEIPVLLRLSILGVIKLHSVSLQSSFMVVVI